MAVVGVVSQPVEGRRKAVEWQWSVSPLTSQHSSAIIRAVSTSPCRTEPSPGGAAQQHVAIPGHCHGLFFAIAVTGIDVDHHLLLLHAPCYRGGCCCCCCCCTDASARPM